MRQPVTVVARSHATLRKKYEIQVAAYPKTATTAARASAGPAAAREIPAHDLARAAVDQRAVALAVEQRERRNDPETQHHAPDHPDLVRVEEERVEKQRSGIDKPVAAPRLLREGGIARQALAHPLVFDGPLEEELRNQKRRPIGS